MDIYDFEYKNKHIKNRVYDVLPLSNKGFNQYISGESYTHKYIEPNPPKLREEKDQIFSSTCNNFNVKNLPFSAQKEQPEDRCLFEIYANKNKENDYENYYNSQQKIEHQQNKEEINNNKEIEECNGNEPEVFHNTQSPSNLGGVNKINYINKTNNQNQTNSILNNLKKFRTNNSQDFNKSVKNEVSKNFNPSIKYSKINSDSKPKGKNSVFSISTEKSFNFKKANLDPLSRRLNYTSSDFFKTTNNNQNSKVLKNNNNISTCPSRYDKNYLRNVNLFINSKSYFEMDKIKDDKPKKYDGFQSYAVPNLDNYKKDQEDFDKKKSPCFNLTQKIFNSCNGMKKNQEEISQENLKFTKKNENLKKDPYEENEKLKKIMFLQTNSEFLKKNKIPEIQKFIEQPGIKIHSNPKGLTKKNMGESYNPYNYLPGRDCETRRRNVTGALFNH